MYSLVSQHLGVSDSAVAFVSSNFWDIAGAKSFGFWTCWVNRGKLPEEELMSCQMSRCPLWMGLLMFWGTQLRVGESAQKCSSERRRTFRIFENISVDPYLLQASESKVRLFFS